MPRRKRLALPGVPRATPAVGRDQFAAQIAEKLSASGLSAEVADPRAIHDFVRRHAEQLLAAAARCKFAEERVAMETTAKAVLAELDQLATRH